MSSVFKILTEAEWNQFQTKKEFAGTKLDLKDGFIHLSSKEQVEGVVQRYFSNEEKVYIVEFSKPEFIQKLVWEPAKSGEEYPHLYHESLQFHDIYRYQERKLKS